MKRAGRIIGWTAAAAAWAACIGVIANYNIAPALENADDASTRALIGLQILCTLLLSMIQIDRGKRLSWFENLSLSILLIVFNVWAGMDTTNRINEAAGGANADKIAQAGQYEKQIAALQKQIEALGAFKPTSSRQVEVAQGAVKEASYAVRVCGHYCDKGEKEKALTKAQARLDELAGWQALTDKAAGLESDLKDLQGKLAALGNVPKHANRTAAQVASYIGTSEAEVEKWQPLVRSVGIEMINRLAPGWVFLLIIGLGGAAEQKQEAAAKPAKAAKQEAPAPTLLRKPLQVLARATATMAGPVPVEPVRPAAVAKPDRDSVAEWHSACIAHKHGEEIAATSLQEHYQRWCAKNGKAPVTHAKTFCQLLRQLGMQVNDEKSASNKKLYFVDVAFAAPKLHLVANAGVSM